MIPNSVLTLIKKDSLFIDWKVSFDGKSVGNRHLFRVAKIAKYIAQSEGAKVDVAVAGAWLHDIGLSKGDDNVPSDIRKIAENYLKKLPISSDLQVAIADCVESHESNMKAKTLEAKVVHDADVIDKSGILGIIRHTWKTVNLINPNADRNELYDLLSQHLFLRKSLMYTPTGKTVIKPFSQILKQFLHNKKNALETIEFISNNVKRGVNSENIAKKLISNQKLKPKYAKSLTVQIKCNYLH